MEVDRLAKLSAVIGLIAIILEIVGLATRGWVRFKEVIPIDQIVHMGSISNLGFIEALTVKVEFGLWTIALCMNDICATIKRSDWATNASLKRYSALLDVVSYQVLTSLSVVFGVISLLFLVLHIRRPVLVNKCYGLLSLGGFVLSGALLWYVVGKFAALTTNLHPTLSQPEGLTAMTPYSVVVTAIGALLSFVVAILTFVEVCQTSCLGEGGLVINKFPTIPHNTLVNINHPNPVPPPTAAPQTHVGITVQNCRM